MSLRKWIYILLFGGFIIIGMPTAANSDETDTSSVKECRVHIEKALEQYWDKKEPSERTNSDYETLTDQEEADDSAIQEPDDEDDDDDHDTTENEDALTHKGYQIEDQDEEDDDDDDEEDDANNEDDDDDNEDDDSVPDMDKDSLENDVKSETDDEDDEEDEDESSNDGSPMQPSSMRRISSIDTKSIEGKDSTDTDDDEDDDEEENDEAAEDDDDDEEENDNAEEKDEDEEESASEDENVDTEDTKDEELNEEEEGDEEEDDEEDQIDLVKESIVDDIKEEVSVSSSLSNEIPKEETQVPVAPEALPEEKEPLEMPQVEKDATIAEEINSESEEEEESESETPSPIPERDDDTIENIYEDDDDDESPAATTFRSREHVDLILDLDGKGQEWEQEQEKLAQSIFKEIRKIETTSIRPMELLYKYSDSTTQILGDAELFNKPMLLFLGPWNAGKTSIINYILGIENTPAALKTGTGITDTDFTIITSGDRQRVVSGTELAADWRYAGTQKFGQGFLDHFRSIHIQNALLEKVIICDTPGILENRKNAERGYSLNDVFQWFIDRADAVYVVLDPAKVDIGAELGSVIEQLKGRDARFILNKADSIRRSDLMRVVGQLFWNLSPLMSSTEAPIIYAVSLTSRPYHPSAPTKFLADQEKNFFYDMKSTLEKHVENKILYARKHAVRVRNHAKMVDCFLATYYRHKSIFSSKRNIAKLITENPREYNIFDGYGSVTNISRFDLPSPQTYKEFFKVHPLYDFKPLASTCSYFRGCPMDKLDQAIAKDIPELLAKYQKSKNEIAAAQKQER